MWFAGWVSGPNPDRLDAVTDVLLREAGDLAEPVAVLDDVAGALTRVLMARGVEFRVWCDDLREEEAAVRACRDLSPTIASTPAEALADVRTVLWRLPKAVSAVEEYAELIAQHAAPDVRVFAAGRDKHLSRSMNQALASRFTNVRASLGYRKARALLADGPIPGQVTWPRSGHLDVLDLEVSAHGATFNTFRLDRGTALLASVFDRVPDADRAIDLGCGSGILASLLARQGRSVTAIDVTWSACDATRLTAEAHGLTIDVQRRDGLAHWAEPVDLIVTNPPFHIGTAKDTEPTRRLFEQVGAALADHGEFWCVYNAHLPYLAWLRDSIGPTQIVMRDRAYVLTRSAQTALPLAPVLWRSAD
ncbi:Ribosomal RNA large subunit methyltransferase G [Micropruina glycogenica]|uniref:Ribosomal RNA large subunit methyltransferase G n=1 Tax=Micropruina glycogenica TaxID=75385 RepID=A0A2N9JC96_9ACTN|nr:Ribosomal RNA large subunit methyltransferase G [Micropruina glycogenica]